MKFSLTALAAPLLVTIVVSIIVIFLVAEMTKAPIEQVSIRRDQKVIQSVMPLEHDNDVLNDVINITAVGDLGSPEPVPVYRARKSATPVGVIILPVAPDGYNGPIRLAVGISFSGELLAVKILRHTETSDYGDLIHQDKSDWLLKFAGKSSDQLAGEDSVDQVTGATISSSAVIKAVIRCLGYYEREKDRLY